MQRDASCVVRVDLFSSPAEDRAPENQGGSNRHRGRWCCSSTFPLCPAFRSGSSTSVPPAPLCPPPLLSVLCLPPPLAPIPSDDSSDIDLLRHPPTPAAGRRRRLTRLPPTSRRSPSLSLSIFCGTRRSFQDPTLHYIATPQRPLHPESPPRLGQQPTHQAQQLSSWTSDRHDGGTTEDVLFLAPLLHPSRLLLRLPRPTPRTQGAS